MAHDRVVAVINSKGGVGKTTITANLGGVLASQLGSRVLLVDLDPQGNLAEDLGYGGSPIDDDGESLATALSFGGSRPLTVHENVRPNLDVVVGGDHLNVATSALIAKAGSKPQDAKKALARLLDPLVDAYDLVLIDCPPGQAPLQQAALSAARWVLIPVKTDASSIKGLADVGLRLDAVIDVNPQLDLLGVVIFGVNRAAHRVIDDARRDIADNLNGDTSLIFETTVRHAEAPAQEARRHGKLAHELDEAVRSGPKFWERIRGTVDETGPRSRSALGLADDFHALAGEALQRIIAAESAPAGSR